MAHTVSARPCPRFQCGALTMDAALLTNIELVQTYTSTHKSGLLPFVERELQCQLITVLLTQGWLGYCSLIRFFQGALWGF